LLLLLLLLLLQLVRALLLLRPLLLTPSRRPFPFECPLLCQGFEEPHTAQVQPRPDIDTDKALEALDFISLELSEVPSA
jgi:hypothetical protein